MKPIVISVLAGLLLGMPHAPVRAQDGDGAPPVRVRQVDVNLAPVTQAEAKKAIDRLDGMLRKIIGLPAGAATTELPSDQPATREEIVRRLERLRVNLSEAYVITPWELPVDEARLTIGSDAKPLLVTMIREGYVPNVCPIATGDAPGLSPAEFGDLLAYFGARVAELAHVPSSDWSPYLQNPYRSG